jgi:hypothetical protein
MYVLVCKCTFICRYVHVCDCMHADNYVLHVSAGIYMYCMYLKWLQPGVCRYVHALLALYVNQDIKCMCKCHFNAGLLRAEWDMLLA